METLKIIYPCTKSISVCFYMLANGLSHIYGYSYELFRAKQKETLNLLSKTEEILSKTEDDLFGNWKNCKHYNMPMSLCFFLFVFVSQCISVLSQGNRPNFVLILMDDQDLMLDSPSYMPNLQSLIVNEGMTFKNGFTATPVCCPSRTEFVSGRYFHNIGAPGGTCMNVNADGYVFNPNSIFSQMYTNGYKTGVFGKLTNNDAGYFCNKPKNITAAGMSRVYSMCNPGDYYVTKYINYTESNPNPYQYTNLSYNDPGTYQGSQLGNKSVEFIESNLKSGNNFLAYIGFHEPHLQYTPAAWFANAFNNVTLPRPPSFNVQTKGQMPWLNVQPALNQSIINDMTKIYQDRLASTLQVDVAINDIYNMLNKYNQLNNTYIIYLSDHGYHLGEYRIPCEKHQMFDTDIRIPYYIRGPGIVAKSKVDFIVGNVDIMPTVLDLARIPIPNTVDGKSFKSKMLSNSADPWRDIFLVEYMAIADRFFNVCSTWYSEPNDFHGQNIKPSPFTSNNELVVINFGQAENFGNNYRAIRIINSTHDIAYAEYVNYTFTPKALANPYLYVLYDLTKDPYELENIYPQTTKDVQTELNNMLVDYGKCQGQTCP